MVSSDWARGGSPATKPKPDPSDEEDWFWCVKCAYRDNGAGKSVDDILAEVPEDERFTLDMCCADAHATNLTPAQSKVVQRMWTAGWRHSGRHPQYRKAGSARPWCARHRPRWRMEQLYGDKTDKVARRVLHRCKRRLKRLMQDRQMAAAGTAEQRAQEPIGPVRLSRERSASRDRGRKRGRMFARSSVDGEDDPSSGDDDSDSNTDDGDGGDGDGEDEVDDGAGDGANGKDEVDGGDVAADVRADKRARAAENGHRSADSQRAAAAAYGPITRFHADELPEPFELTKKTRKAKANTMDPQRGLQVCEHRSGTFARWAKKNSKRVCYVCYCVSDPEREEWVEKAVRAHLANYPKEDSDKEAVRLLRAQFKEKE